MLSNLFKPHNKQTSLSLPEFFKTWKNNLQLWSTLLSIINIEQVAARLKVLGNYYNQHTKNNKGQVLEEN